MFSLVAFLPSYWLSFKDSRLRSHWIRSLIGERVSKRISFLVLGESPTSLTLSIRVESLNPRKPINTVFLAWNWRVCTRNCGCLFFSYCFSFFVEYLLVVFSAYLCSSRSLAGTRTILVETLSSEHRNETPKVSCAHKKTLLVCNLARKDKDNLRFSFARPWPVWESSCIFLWVQYPRQQRTANASRAVAVQPRQSRRRQDGVFHESLPGQLHSQDASLQMMSYIWSFRPSRRANA